jgi:hypothetical protein
VIQPAWCLHRSARLQFSLSCHSPR